MVADKLGLSAETMEYRGNWQCYFLSCSSKLKRKDKSKCPPKIMVCFIKKSEIFTIENRAIKEDYGQKLDEKCRLVGILEILILL